MRCGLGRGRPYGSVPSGSTGAPPPRAILPTVRELRALVYADPSDRRELEALLERLAGAVGGDRVLSEAVAGFIADVRRDGDAALVGHMRTFSDPGFEESMLRVPAQALRAAADRIAQELRAAMERAIDHVRRYQEHITPEPPLAAEIDGARLGLRFKPVGSAGLLVPGGRAAYPSTLIMLAVPAQVAGVGRVCLATPPPDADRGAGAGGIDDSVLAAAHLLGIDEVYCIGGSHAVAALACGTGIVAAVDFIAGPGSVYVQEAKRQLFGTVGVDGLYGPSEIAILADGSVAPAWIAADVLAQLEHDPGAAFVVSAHAGVLDRVRSALKQQIAERGRQEAIERGLYEFTAFVLAADDEEACAIMNRIAPEHAVLAVADPHAVLDRVHCAGAYFLGGAPVASGDYYAGPSHCLPTGSTARFSSGCSVYTFLRRSSLEEYPIGMDRRAIDDIAALAEAEGLDAHAASVRIRGD